MSYIFNNNPLIKYADSPNLDAFGRLRVSEVTSLIELSHVYDKRPRLIDEMIGGTATSTHAIINSQVVMSGTGANSYVIRQSYFCAPYQPGKGQLFEASFGNFQIETNVIKRVGQFTTSSGSTYFSNPDGYFLESNGLTNKISFQVWKTGTLSFSAETSSWNNDEFSLSNIDWSKTQLMMIDYQWLGVGRIRFHMIFGGIPYLMYEHTGTNNLNTVYMSSPSKPIRYELRTLGGTGSFNQICSQVSIEGTLNDLWTPCGITHEQTTTLTSSGVKYAYLGIRPSPTYKQVSPNLKGISIMNTSNDDYLVTLEIDPTISGTYTWTGTSQIEMEKVLGDGSQTIISGGDIIASFIGAAGTNTITSFELSDSQVHPGLKIDGTNQSIWVCITPLGANATFRGSVNLLYRK